MFVLLFGKKKREFSFSLHPNKNVFGEFCARFAEMSICDTCLDCVSFVNMWIHNPAAGRRRRREEKISKKSVSKIFCENGEHRQCNMRMVDIPFLHIEQMIMMILSNLYAAMFLICFKHSGLKRCRLDKPSIYIILN